MRRAAPVQEEAKEFAPLWITTFADLISQLFTFFVLMLVLGSVQEAGMIGALRESFVYSLKNFGLRGSLAGQANRPGQFNQTRYSVNDPEPTDERTLDAKVSELHSLYSKLLGSMEAVSGQLTGEKIVYLPKDIHFAKGSAELTAPIKELLRRDISELKADLHDKDVKIYVLGLAPEESTQWQQWTISARRAEAVAGFMRSMLPAGLGWQVYSWGAGNGGEWTGQKGQVAKEVDIMVAVIRK